MERKSLLPVDVLVPWKIESNPYGSSFSPSILYEDILQVLSRYENLNEFAIMAYQGNTRSERHHIAVEDASLIHNLLSTHVNLCRLWVDNIGKVDALVPLNIPTELISTVLPLIVEEATSLSSAGRIPMLICDSFEATERPDANGSVITWLKIPETFFPLCKALAPLLAVNQCLVMPIQTSIDSCISEYENAEWIVESYKFAGGLEDIYAYDRNAIDSVSP